MTPVVEPMVFNETPHIDPDKDLVFARADAPDGSRFLITVSRVYVEDVWQVPWKDASAAFTARAADLLAMGERARDAGQHRLDLRTGYSTP